MPKRVLVVAGRMDYGGLEIMIMNFFRLMDKQKVVFDFMLNYEEKGAFDDEILKLGGKIYIMPRLFFKNMFKYILAVNSFFRQHRGEYDVVHGHLTSVGIIYLLIAKIYGVKTTIIHAHYADTKNNLKGKIEKLTISPLRFCADYYFACSNKAGAFCYGKNKLKKSNYRVINNGVVVRKFIFDPVIRQNKREELNIQEKFAIIHIGRFEKEKNHSFLLKVFENVHKLEKNAVLLLVGNGSMIDEIKTQAQILGISDSVKFLGIRQDISELLNASDLFVMPSLYEGLPVVSVEAQTSGIKCIFSNTITKEVDITGNCTFLSLQDDLQSWAKEILKNRQYERADESKKIIKAGYSIEEQAKWLQDFYLHS